MSKVYVPNRQANRLGFVTSYSVDANLIDVTTWNDFVPTHARGSGLIRFEGRMPASDAALDVIRDWMNQGISGPVWTPEWRCLYCGSPQKLDRTHCEKCGAPRNWILG